MISLGFFSKNEEKVKKTDEEVEMIDIMFYESSDGQLMFC